MYGPAQINLWAFLIFRLFPITRSRASARANVNSPYEKTRLLYLYRNPPRRPSLVGVCGVQLECTQQPLFFVCALSAINPEMRKVCALYPGRNLRARVEMQWRFIMRTRAPLAFSARSFFCTHFVLHAKLSTLYFLLPLFLSACVCFCSACVFSLFFRAFQL